MIRALVVSISLIVVLTLAYSSRKTNNSAITMQLSAFDPVVTPQGVVDAASSIIMPRDLSGPELYTAISWGSGYYVAVPTDFGSVPNGTLVCQQKTFALDLVYLQTDVVCEVLSPDFLHAPYPLSQAALDLELGQGLAPTYTKKARCIQVKMLNLIRLVYVCVLYIYIYICTHIHTAVFMYQ
jgi:hypothetical protein